MIIKDIAEYEDTDSELAKYTITNLHHEIERLKEEYIRLQKRFNYLMEAHKTCDEENERLNKSLGDMTILFAKEREKTRQAIEYLESYNTDFKNCKFGEAPISIRELGNLLDILKGEDKNE